MSSWFQKSCYAEGDTASHIDVRMRGLLNDLALDHYSYGLLEPPLASNDFNVPPVFSTYPAEWLLRYTERQYMTIDPVCELTEHSTRPFYWGQGRFLRQFKKQQRAVFNEATEFGISYGLSIPIRGASGEVATFNVVSSNRNHLKDVVSTEHERLFQAAFDTHDKIMDSCLCSSKNERPEARLTLREKECLLWTLEGKTAEGVAKQLGLSVYTVNRHASTATQKLGCTSKHHAAVYALRQGLI